jgi:hypothetical protein
MRNTVASAVLLVALCACDSETGDPLPSGGHGGAATSGAGGAVAGSGGAAGSAGNGTSAGSGGAAGMAGGTGGTGGEAPGCAAADTSGAPSALHAAAAAILTTASPCNTDQACPCGSSSCHGGRGKANLVLVGAMDLNTALVGKTSCQALALPVVAPGGGDAALNGSWLWLKLVAPVDGSGVIAADASWGEPQVCNQMPAMPYGYRMPLSNTDMPLSEARLAPIRNWICAGAPGP